MQFVQRSRVDLHIHSVASDGVFTPSEVVRMALAHDLEVIALTDHDTLHGVSKAQRAAAGTGLEVISGVEVSSEGEWGDLHILGYFVDPDDGPLQERLKVVRDARVGRAHKMVERLREMGVALEWEEVQAIALGESIGRPHVARALVGRRSLKTVQEAFDRFISIDGPAYVPRMRLLPGEVIRMITAAGGVPVLAHPIHSGRHVVALIPELVRQGLRGLEVHYPNLTAGDIGMLLRLCREYDLRITGGTDFHGPEVKAAGAALGTVHVPMACVDGLREAAGLG